MKKTVLIFALISSIAVVMSSVLEDYFVYGLILSLILVIVNIVILVNAYKKDDIGLMLLMLFVFQYSIVPIGYYFFKQQIGFQNYCENPRTVFETLSCFLLFVLLMAYNVRFQKKEDIQLLILNSSSAYILCALFAAFSIAFGVTGDNIFEGGGYGEADKNSSSLFEYGILPISMMLILSSSKLKLYTTYFFVLFFVVKNLIYGGRVETLILCLTVTLIRLQYVWSKKKILLALFVGFVLMASWGVFRSSVSGSFTLSLKDGNASEVYFSSMRIHYMIDNDLLTNTERRESLFWFFAGAFLPANIQPDTANLSLYKQSLYYCGGGGLAPTFFYAYAGFIGVVILGLFISYCLNKRNSSSSAIRYYALLIISMSPRWLAYSPRHLIKICLVGMAFYVIINEIFKPKVKRKY